MIIKPEPLQHWISNFYGYGSWNAPVWFVANEEGGGDVPEEVAEKLNYFDRHHASDPSTLCDIREMYRHVAFRFGGPKRDLFETLYDYRFGPNAGLHGSWKNLVGFAHGYRNKELPDLLEYQRTSFARPGYGEALIRLYPLPSATSHAWYYSWLDLPQFPFLKSREAYREHLYDTRIKRILTNIGNYKPEVVLMYGMGNIQALKRSVQAYFPEVKFTMVKAIKLQAPQYHRADLDGTVLLITTQIPALRHNRVETGFDWHGLGRLVRRV